MNKNIEVIINGLWAEYKIVSPKWRSRNFEPTSTGDNNTYTMYTGSAGARQFNEAIGNLTAEEVLNLSTNPIFIDSNTSDRAVIVDSEEEIPDLTVEESLIRTRSRHRRGATILREETLFEQFDRLSNDI